jgi:hypothetical protein
MRVTRKQYQIPAMLVISLQQSSALLQASPGIDSNRQDYGDAEEETWP